MSVTITIVWHLFATVILLRFGGMEAVPVDGLTQNPELSGGDSAGINLLAVRSETNQRGAFIDSKSMEEGKPWLDKVVPYVLSPNYNDTGKAIITDAMAFFMYHTCVKFVERETEDDYLEIEPNDNTNSSKCYSDIGKSGKAQKFILPRVAECLENGIIQHELMHAIGFYHEHSRSDRDQYVEINWNNIAKLDRHNFIDQKATGLGKPYDFASVMHYGKNDFAQNPNEWTIRPKSNYKMFENLLGQRRGLSFWDIAKINVMYNCSETLESSVPGYINRTEDCLSQHFIGPCFSSANCRATCEGEGYKSGHCSTAILPKCWCEGCPFVGKR